MATSDSGLCLGIHRGATDTDRLATLWARYQWAFEELLLDGLYRRWNTVSGARAQSSMVRAAYGCKPPGKLSEMCEDLTLYYFACLRAQPVDMVAFLVEDLGSVSTLVYAIELLVAAQSGRRKTIGLRKGKK